MDYFYFYNIMIKQNRILKENNLGYQKMKYPSKKDNFIQTPFRSKNSNINFSIIDDLLLTDFIDSENKDLLYGEVKRLAYISSNKQIHIDEEALYILQRFSSNQISFASIYGQKNAGKSLLLDKILNLAGFQGTHFCRTSQNYQKGLYFWSIPFVKNKETKVFFLDCVGFDAQQKFSRQQQMIMDLMMILSSSVVILPSPQDKKYEILPFIVKKIKQSMARITQNKVAAKPQSEYWPKNAYCLYRNPSKIDQQNEQLQNIFSCYNFLVIHDAMPQQLALAGVQSEDLVQIQGIPSKNSSDLYINGLYVKQASRLVRDILDKINVKSYYGLKYNGNICCKLLLTLIKYLNKKQKIKIDKIFYSLLKQLYQSAYSYHTQFYDERLQEYFIDDSCVSMDYLTQAFRNSRQIVLISFNQLTINDQMHLEYQEMLQKYIQQKEILILQINRKKTKFHLKNAIKQEIKFPKTYYDNQQIGKFVMSLNNLESDLDHDRCYPICDTLIQYSIHLQKKYLSDALQYEKQIIQSLNMEKQEKKKYLQGQKNRNMRNTILNNDNEAKYKDLLGLNQNLDSKTKNIKKQIQIQRKFQKQYIANKESAKQRAQELLIYVRQLQQAYRDNEKVVQQINKQFQYNPTIQILQKRIDQKQRLIKELQKNQSDISQLNFRRRSQVRNIQGSSNIHSSSVLR